MRVTNKSLTENYTNNMQLNLQAMLKYQNQLASGKEINKPSDDPYRVVKTIGLESVLSKNEQYKKNIGDAQGWMNMTDTAVQEMITVMNRFKGQITQAGSVISSSASLVSIAEEMGQNVGRLAQVANTTFDGRYIFGGYATDKAPFVVDTDSKELTRNTDVADADAAGQIIRTIAPAVEFPINVTATRVMNGDTGDDLGTTMQKIYNTIRNEANGANVTPNFLDDGPPTNSPSGPLTATSTFQEQLDFAMKEVERHFDNLTSIAAEVGAKQNRLESAMNRNMEQTLSTTELLSKTEDIDYVEKITQYMSMSNVYEAALASGSKILQLSLVNYLK